MLAFLGAVNPVLAGVGEGVLQLYAKCIVPIPIKLITVH
jgi:hypothetical protein